MLVKCKKRRYIIFKKNGIINKEYFSPALLSSTYSAKNVNNFYNEFKEKINQSPVTIRFASDNPRNIANQATKKESELLRKF